jgi:hypothetical protein
MGRLCCLLAGTVALALVWTQRSRLRSIAMLLVASALPNSAKRHGIDIRIPSFSRAWIRPVLRWISVPRSQRSWAIPWKPPPILVTAGST